MKSIPILITFVFYGLIISFSSCEKNVKPNKKQINTCTECGSDFKDLFSKETFTLKYYVKLNEWTLSSERFNVLIPCEFPTNLLLNGTIIIADGKFATAPYRSRFTNAICIEKIY
jgi:hypothetical protein